MYDRILERDSVMKKIISLFLIICVILSISPSLLVGAATQYTYNQAKALEYAANHWNDGVGLCAEFVSKCVRAGGISINIETFAGSCFKAVLKNSYAEKHQLNLNEKGQATKADNGTILAPGDVVVQYCTTCKKYPHILVFSEFDSNGKACYYAHNGALGNKTFTLSKNKALHGKNSCNVIAYVAHFPQNGGSQQVVDISGNNTSTGNTSNNTQTTSSVKISPNSYPSGNLKYGNDFTLTAKFTSDCAIIEARAYMLDSNKNVIMEAKGSSTTGNYYVEGYALDKGMKFNELSPGEYYLKYYVKDANGDTNTWTSDKFYIVKEEEKKPVVDMSTIDNGTQSTPKEPESTLSINLTSFPSSIENGESVQLQGNISSNYIIVKVEAMLWGSEGIGYYLTTIYPNSKSVRIENTDLSDGIYFEGMPGGTYTLEIIAKDEKTTKEITKSIKISERKIEKDDNLYSANNDIEINNNKNFEYAKKQKCGNNAYWDFDNGVLTISGAGKMNDYSSPWELPWYDIQSDVRKIVIEEGITYIGNNAFCWHGANSNNSINIEEIYIPSTVEGLGNCTFAYVDGVDTVYYNARDCEFTGTSLTFAYNYFARGTKLVIGEDVERIGANVFYRGQFDKVVCIGDWNTISTDMTGNEVLRNIETESNDDEIVVKVDGRKVNFDQPPIIQDGRTLVPVRAACEAMGINVHWIESEQRVILTKYGEEFDMQIGNKKYWMNQVSYYYFDVPPQIINGRTLLPIRAIAQFFGYDVNWNGDTQTVIIESE